MNLDQESKGIRMAKAVAHKTSGTTKGLLSKTMSRRESRKSWADRDNARNRRASNFGDFSESESRSGSRLPSQPGTHRRTHKRHISPPREVLDRLNNFNPLMGNDKDVEAQRAARNRLADALFAGVNDELEDLTPEERDQLVQRAFRHSALRARRPVIWIPGTSLASATTRCTAWDTSAATSGSATSDRVWIPKGDVCIVVHHLISVRST